MSLPLAAAAGPLHEAGLSGSNPSGTQAPASELRPWYREGMVWLVIGGPLVVVVAAIATAVIAYRGADPLVKDLPGARQVVRPTGETPALQARNHAATAAAAAPAEDR